jgi:hypothetical protein
MPTPNCTNPQAPPPYRTSINTHGIHPHGENKNHKHNTCFTIRMSTTNLHAMGFEKRVGYVANSTKRRKACFLSPRKRMGLLALASFGEKRDESDEVHALRLMDSDQIAWDDTMPFH